MEASFYTHALITCRRETYMLCHTPYSSDYSLHICQFVTGFISDRNEDGALHIYSTMFEHENLKFVCCKRELSREQ